MDDQITELTNVRKETEYALKESMKKSIFVKEEKFDDQITQLTNVRKEAKYALKDL